jgi:hypothetical protein
MSEPAKHPTRPRALACAAALLLGLYGAALYFQVATASLYDTHQPGIEALRRTLQPGVVLVLVSLLAWLRKSPWTIQLSRWVNGGAVLCCALMLMAVTLHSGTPPQWQPPEDRSLWSTLEQAILHPSFSNRSTFSAVKSGLFAAVLLMGAMRWRKLQIQ